MNLFSELNKFLKELFPLKEFRHNSKLFSTFSSMRCHSSLFTKFKQLLDFIFFLTKHAKARDHLVAQIACELTSLMVVDSLKQSICFVVNQTLVLVPLSTGHIRWRSVFSTIFSYTHGILNKICVIVFAY